MADKRLSVSVSTTLHKELRICAAQQEVSMNTVVVNALKDYLRHCHQCGSEKTRINDFS